MRLELCGELLGMIENVLGMKFWFLCAYTRRMPAILAQPSKARPCENSRNSSLVVLEHLIQASVSHLSENS